jgi:hypothetical protein
MGDSNLIGLLDINQEYGFQREVDPAMVLGEFLARFWSQGSQASISNLTDSLSDNLNNVGNIITGGKYDPTLLKETLTEYLKSTLLINPEAFERRLLKSKSSGKKLDDKELRKIPYCPLNHRFLIEPTSIQLGRQLYLCLDFESDKNRINNIKERLLVVEQHQETEEKIIAVIFDWPAGNHENRQAKEPGGGNPPGRAKEYISLFKQFAEDLESLLQLDIKLMSKTRILLYLERLVNLYALLYYLRIICDYTDKKKKPGADPPLIIPLCSEEADDEFKDYSTRCFEVYRQKAVASWREYLKKRIEQNADVLKCTNDKAEDILEKFIANETQIFRLPKKSKKVIEQFKKDIKGILEQVSNITNSGIERFTEAYLAYNLTRNRTLVRLRRVLDWQGPGAGIAAPEKGNVKHFHLKPELLETLVIIFSNRYKTRPSQLSLRNFVSETRARFGIILGHSPGLEESVKKQELPGLKNDLFKKNSDNFISMLRSLNMLESLSDMAMYIKCPFPLLPAGKGDR